jgi:hypothetical protein
MISRMSVISISYAQAAEFQSALPPELLHEADPRRSD